jgi:hypothetical protein
MAMHSYLISGLHVISELELPGAIPEARQAKAADVSIRRGSVPLALEAATASGPNWEMEGDLFLLRVPRLARFRIAAGRDIAVATEPGVTDRDAAVFVLGTAFGILLHQRGALVLHGAAVAKDGRAIAICGASGAGKSTLAAALCREGYSFVTDDICVIGLNEHRRPVVLPDGRQLKLWKESIDRLDLAERQGEAVRGSLEKYYIDPSDARAQPSLLSAIYVLREALPPLQEGIETLALPDAMRTLDQEAYRPQFRARIGRKPEMLAQAAAMFGHAKAFILIRPRGFEHLPETVTALRTHWASLDA